MKNKELKLIAEKYSLSCNIKKSIAYGKYRGYDVCIFYDIDTNRYNILVPIKQNGQIDDIIIKSFLSEKQSNNKKILYAAYENYAIKMQIGITKIKQDKSDALQGAIDDIIKFLETHNLQTCCELCGEEIETQIFLINDKPSYACKSCQSNIKNEIAQAQENVMSKKGNILTGIVGGIIGSLIGVALWVIIYSLGYLASIAGLAIAICTIKGYEMLGGKINKLGILITFIITIIMVYVAQYLALGVEIYQVFKNDVPITILDALKSVPDFLLENEVRRSFYSDLSIGYLLTLVGSISTFKHTYKQKNFNIKTEVI